ncbi:PREDICTED: uncharacterized protein LOC102013566 isoform X2 [Chinchilla lanigera]|uniref:uncharacterized protein LOC102013566 isoform X2 n=1 Tax=Chinchilla lanigera TaxID=34839 RepID=UPI000697D433|nr:PREDICTED: uncharacterized protein LOC102013566 isoform X2 [Chinchilla lanigera]
MNSKRDRQGQRSHKVRRKSPWRGFPTPRLSLSGKPQNRFSGPRWPPSGFLRQEQRERAATAGRDDGNWGTRSNVCREEQLSLVGPDGQALETWLYPPRVCIGYERRTRCYSVCRRTYSTGEQTVHGRCPGWSPWADELGNCTGRRWTGEFCCEAPAPLPPGAYRQGSQALRQLSRWSGAEPGRVSRAFIPTVQL